MGDQSRIPRAVCFCFALLYLTALFFLFLFLFLFRDAIFEHGDCLWFLAERSYVGNQYVLSALAVFAFLLRPLIWPGLAASIFANENREPAGKDEVRVASTRPHLLTLVGDLKIVGQGVW